MSDQLNRHYWTTTERRVLLILRDEYHLAWNDLTPLFNSWLGQSHGLLQQVLYSQYVYIAHSPSKARQRKVQNILLDNHNDAENLRGQLKETATKLGIQLVQRNLDDDSKTKDDRHIKRKRSSLETHVPTPTSKRQRLVESENIQNQPSTPEHNFDLITPPQTLKASRVPAGSFQQQSPTLAIRSVQRKFPNAMSTSMPENNLPLIGFRGYSYGKSQGLNSASGFRAGAFLNAARIPMCPNPTEAEFILEANLHAAWTKGHPSPFISITTSFIRAIMKSRSPKSGRHLAVFDLKKVQQSSSIFEAKSLGLQPLKPDGTPVDYHSGGEYLVWGHISVNAIITVIDINSLINPPPAVLGDTDPLELKFIGTAWRRVAIRCELNKKGRMMLSYQAGIAIGSLIRRLHLTSAYTEAATSLMIADWQFKTKKAERWQDNVIFCQGLNLGLQNDDLLEAGNDTRGDNSDEDDLNFLQQLELAASDRTSECSEDKSLRTRNEVGPAGISKRQDTDGEWR